MIGPNLVRFESNNALYNNGLGLTNPLDFLDQLGNQNEGPFTQPEEQKNNGHHSTDFLNEFIELPN